MLYDRDDHEARPLLQAAPTAQPQANEFPELPLGADAFRSPLHTLPASAPAASGPQPVRLAFFVVATLAVAVGVIAAIALRDPAPEVTEAHEDQTPVAPRTEPAAVIKPAGVLAATAPRPIPVEEAQREAAAPERVEPPTVEPPAAKVAQTRSAKPSRKTTTSRRSKTQRRPRAKPVASALPELPKRQAVLAAMRNVTQDTRSCLSKPMRAKVDITFAGKTGKVSAANVHGVTGATASCVARAVRRAKLPPFSKPQLDISYPFRAPD